MSWWATSSVSLMGLTITATGVAFGVTLGVFDGKFSIVIVSEIDGEPVTEAEAEAEGDAGNAVGGEARYLLRFFLRFNRSLDLFMMSRILASSIILSNLTSTFLFGLTSIVLRPAIRRVPGMERGGEKCSYCRKIQFSKKRNDEQMFMRVYASKNQLNPVP